MTKVAIVTVDYNNHDDTRELLESGKDLDTSDLEILWLVVDNGSNVSVKNVVDQFPKVVWMQTGSNLGFAGGYNHGMKYAKAWGANYILLINNDTLLPDKDVLKKMLKVFNNNPRVGLVSPKIYFAPKYEFYKERYSKDDCGHVIWYAGGKYDWDNIQAVHKGIDQVDVGQFCQIEKTEFVSGCCVFVKCEVIEKVGYFEEKLFAYYEDADWVERVKRAGFEQWYMGKTYIYHKVSRTSVIGSNWTDYLITRNRLWLGLKYASLRTKFALIRESARLLILGRPAQKEGVVDYFKGTWGYKYAKEAKNAQYPLDLSINIINYKTTDLTLKLLESVYSKDSGIDDVKGGVEVIVLDNSPEESCKHTVISKYPQVKFIQNNINNGFSAGNNQMINYSLGKNILLLNSDIEVKPKGLTNILNAIKVGGENAIYSGKLFFPDGTLQDSCYMLPTPIGAFKEYFLGKKGSYFMFSSTDNKIKKVEGVVMACFLIPQKVLNKMGLLQEKTFMYFEDIEYARRAKENNIPIYYVPDAEFIHYHGQSSKQAGQELSTERMIKAAKWYHGMFQYSLVTIVLWAGQKWNKVKAPESKWKSEK